MRFYNLDMHISIIHDVKTIFESLGHSVDSENLSHHTWVNGEKTSKNKVINRSNFDQITQEICDKFYKKYRKKLDSYDGFIHSYPPVFALLFEKFEKPIVTIACTRFDYPVSDINFDWYVSKLRQMQQNGQLIPVANNLFDKKICEANLSYQWEHISSLCNYMQSRYAPNRDEFALWSRSGVKASDLSSRIDSEFTISNRYRREDISHYSGVVHVPYNLSIMSAFEQYYQNIPLFFPSVDFQKRLYQDRSDILNEILFPNSNLVLDIEWLGLADWYDQNNMSNIVYYNSFESIHDLLVDTDLLDVSLKMEIQNRIRESKVMDQWNSLLRRIA